MPGGTIKVMTKKDFAWLQESIGHNFVDEKLRSLAFIHSSADTGQSYERLEFLGDAVLELTVSELLYKQRRDFSEGELTKARAALVNENALAQVAKKHGICDFIVLGKGEENSGGAEKPSILSDVVEALIGAVYLDGGFESAKQLVRRLLSDNISTVLSGGGYRDYKTRLQEHYHKKGTTDISYEVYQEQGPPHDKTFFVKLLVDGAEIARGQGKSKKSAEQRAAMNAFVLFNAGT